MSLPAPLFHRSPDPRKQRAQTLLEFALALPILLLLIFGIIEFGRFLQAWLALENGARFGVRYAVTGNYDLAYCDDAAAALGLVDEDEADGFSDCKVPNEAPYEDTWEELTNQLQDYARLPSIRDAAIVFGSMMRTAQAVALQGGKAGALSAGPLRDNALPMEQNDAELRRLARNGGQS